MKTTLLKTTRGKLLLTGLLALTASVSSVFAGAADDQVAIQLGAIQLGISDVGNATATQQAQALVQGRAVLASTIKGVKPLVQGQTLSPSAIQSKTIQDQIFAANQLALSNPVTTAISGVSVALNNTKSTVVKATLDPKKVTASAIAAYTLKKIPNYGPAIVTTGVQGAFLGGATPVFGYKSFAAQQADAGKVAAAVLSASLKVYAKGTTNWAGVPTTGTVPGATYLPNFGTKVLPSTKVAVGVQQPTNLKGLSSAAAAVSANAINALGAINGQYGQTAANVQALTTALVKGAASFQKTSTSLGASSIGSIGAAGLGIVSQLAGVDNNNWGASTSANDTNAILQGIVNGAIKAAKSQYTAIAIGITQGFVGTYLTTKAATNADTTNAFKTANTADILNSFVLAGAVKLGTSAASALQDSINSAIDAAYTAFGYNAAGLPPGTGPGQSGLTASVTDLTGAGGVSSTLTAFGLVNGVGTPVTDTVGL